MGCGWLGLPLAKAFVECGYLVRGTTTSANKLGTLQKEGITPFLISLSEEKIEGNISGFLADAEIIVINVPPKLRGGNKENYVNKMQLLHTAIKASSVQKILFVSSTSVYGNIEGEVTEETMPQPNTESGKQLLASENIFKNNPEIRTTIIRFGGLIGPGRHPVTILSGRKALNNGNHPVNLIHLNDCISIIKSAIKLNWWGEIFNAVYPFHPPKKEYYFQEAAKRGLKIPEYPNTSLHLGKKIDSHRLIHVKKYIFKTSIQS